MSRSAVLTREARDDLRAQLRWIGPGNMTKVRALRDAVQVAAQRLGRRPLIGRLQTGLLPAPYRFWSLTRFQVVLVYDASSDPPRILRILNTAQDFAPLLASLSEPPRADDPA